MRTLEAIAISKSIIDNVNADVDNLIEDMSKNGFVNVDGNISQYQPGGYRFVNVTDDYLNEYINHSIKNKWSTITLNQIIESLKNGLPQLTSAEINNFNAYLTQYQVQINNELIKTRLNEVLNEYKQYTNIEVTINGGKDIANQLIVMKQNNVFTDLRTRYLYRFRDGEFQIYNNNDIMGLLNSHLSSEDNKVNVSDVQRNRKVYLESLTDIHDIRVELIHKQNRETTLNTCESDYKRILQIIKGY